MYKIENAGCLPIFSWCPNIEESALKQLNNISRLPFAFNHVAAMPDTHAGYGATIGSVFACKDAIVPNAVGKDIGCSVSAYKTNLKIAELNETELKAIVGEIRKVLPFGMGIYPDEDKEISKYLEDLEKEI